MRKTLYYIYDPLCGWCYGAGGAVQALAHSTDVALRMLPSGLFSGEGARPMGEDFAAYAWSNDQRIEQLTGQRFTERYRHEVLSNHQQMFDSGPATLALTAVAQTAPSREGQALKAIQQARYVDGLDITQPGTLASLLHALGLDDAAQLLALPDKSLTAANSARIAQAQALLALFGARGVPAFILEMNGQRQLMSSNAALSNPQTFADQLAAA